LDDEQVVKPDEIGSSRLIKEKALEHGFELFEYDLEAQFRCSGNDGFINWINNTLEIKRTANVLWNLSEGYEFRICDSVEQLEEMIRLKSQEGAKARLTAGFCWKWSSPKPDGQLVDDVIIGEYRRPWNAKPDSTYLAREIPPATLWAYRPEGINQIGCVYTAQGFEFDYIGVIFGTDLVYRHGKGWIGLKENSSDTSVRRSGEQFMQLVKNTYRVLLTRGIKGCFVTFLDKETEHFFRSRTERM
jgi:DUF2075 family protein